MRKRILVPARLDAVAQFGELNVSAMATVLLTSEAPNHPIENAFDGQRGPGASRWVAAEPGEQTIILAFDSPQRITQVTLQVEELHDSRTQELQLAVSTDGGKTYRELLRQEFTFSVPGTSFEHEEWTIASDGVTHLRLWIKPDKGGGLARATLTALALR